MQNIFSLILTTFLNLIFLLPFTHSLAENSGDQESQQVFDGGVTSILGPLSGCGLTNMEHIALEIFNYGSDTIFTMNVGYSINFGPAVTEVFMDTIPPGQFFGYTFTASEDMSFPGSFFIVDAWTDITGDVNSANDTLAGELIEHRSAIGFFPYTEDFENAGLIPLGWVQETTEGPQDWDFTSGGTPSTGTGPDADHTTGSGFYAYVEDSQLDNNRVSLLTPCFDLASLTNAQMSFWVHSNEASGGVPANVNQLRIDLFSNGSWISNIAGTITHIGPFWDFQTIDLSPYTGGIVGIRFRVNNNNGTFSHDIAIDDFTIKEVYPDDLSVIEMLDPVGGLCGDSLTPVRVVVFNAGIASQTGFSINTDISGTFNGTISTVYSDTLHPTEFDTISLPGFNSVLGGPFNFKSYAGLPTDGDNTNDTLLVSNFDISAIPLPPIVSDQFRCDPGTFTFTATGALPQYIFWYDSPVGGNLVGQGASITTPSISNPLTVYAEVFEEIVETVGPANNAFGSGGNFFFLNNQRGHKFDAATDFTMDSCIVYPNNPGNVVVNLVGNNGMTVLNSVTVAVNPPTSGAPVMIPLGFSIPAGTDYELNAAGSTTGGLYRNNAGAVYPYTSPSGTVTITDNIASSAGFYYFFYDIHITVEGCTSERISATADFYPPPAPINLGPDMAVCPGTVIDATTPGLSGYSWSSGDTTTLIVPTTGGAYIVTASDSNTCTTSDTINIFNILPAPQIALGPDTVHCGPYVLNASNPGSDFQWSTGDSTQTITVDTMGTYDVIVTNFFGCVDSGSVVVDILPEPIIDIGPDISGCDQVLVDLSMAGMSCVWSGGGTGPVIPVDSSGTYWVDCTDINGCTGSDTIEVSILPSPVVDLGPDTSACNEVLIDLNHPGLTCVWSAGGMDTIISVTSSGTYWLDCVDLNGCAGSDTVEITINADPVVDLGADATFCLETTLDAGNAGASFLWSTGDTTQTIITSDSGTYSVTVTDVLGCNSSDDITIDIADSPVAGFMHMISGQDLTLQNLSSGSGLSYFWELLPQGDTSSMENPMFTLVGAGSYTITLIVTNPCGSDTTSEIITIGSIQAAKDFASQFQIFPNPNQGDFVIASPDLLSGSLMIELFDVQGKKVYTYDAGRVNGNFEHRITTGLLSNGLYLLKVADDQISGYLKVMIER